jgi:hypothetical protein
VLPAAGCGGRGGRAGQCAWWLAAQGISSAAAAGGRHARTFRSLEAFPASSSTSAVRYSACIRGRGAASVRAGALLPRGRATTGPPRHPGPSPVPPARPKPAHRGWPRCTQQQWHRHGRWRSHGSAEGGVGIGIVESAPLHTGPPARICRCTTTPRTLSRRWTRPTGNWRPARAEREVGFFLSWALLLSTPCMVPLAPLPARPLAPLPLMVAGLSGDGERGEW